MNKAPKVERESETERERERVELCRASSIIGILRV